jgi:hypothetical protein
MTWLRPLAAGFSQQKPGFDLTQINVMDKMALRDVSVRKSESTELLRTRIFLRKLGLTALCVISIVWRRLLGHFFGNEV